MPVPVVEVGKMGVTVSQLLVAVRVCVRFAGRIAVSMHMLVVFVVRVQVVMLHGLVMVLVLVVFREVQPYAGGHQEPGNDEPGRHRFPEEKH